ncbi:hypothetical protein [Streptomyces sp. NPDC058735]
MPVDPQARAVEVLQRAGIDPHEVRARLDDQTARPSGCAGGGETAH